jgi:hypothetical protein
MFSHVVIDYILNCTRLTWLLSDVLNVTIFMSLKRQEEMNYFLLLNALIDDEDFGTFTKNIKIIVMIDSFILLLPI